MTGAPRTTDRPTPTPAMIARLLAVIEADIVPLTRRGVAEGNKIFGAALLRKSDLSLVLAETNAETVNPLWHGEMHCLTRFYERPAADRPPTSDLVFLSTHEPCSLCLSAITWAGLDNFFYFFSHADSRDSFAIPHDLRILREVFRLEPSGYAARNAFWDGWSLRRGIAAAAEPERSALERRAARIDVLYAALSADYQSRKNGTDIPLP